MRRNSLWLEGARYIFKMTLVFWILMFFTLFLLLGPFFYFFYFTPATGAALAISALAATVYAVLMGLILGGFHVYASLRLTRNATAVLPVSYRLEQRLTMAVDAARATALKTSANLNWVSTGRESTDAEGCVTLRFRTPATWRSWSEKIEIRIRPINPSTTLVEIKSKPLLSTVMADFGKSFLNVKAFEQALNLSP